MRLGLIGAGKVGTTLALALHSAGYQIVAAASRGFTSARALAEQIEGCAACRDSQAVVDGSDLVFLAVPDDAIAPVAEGLSWRPDLAVAHCSGALGLDILQSASAAGAQVGSFHPLQAIARVPSSEHRPTRYAKLGVRTSLSGVTFAINAEQPLFGQLGQMAVAVGGRPIRLAGDVPRPLYHASAAFAGYYVVTLLSLAAELWRPLGFSRDQALLALLPLLQGTVDNLREHGLPDALTGPVTRGDLGTVQHHLDALAAHAPHVEILYRQLGAATIPLALEKGGLQPEAAEALRQMFSNYRKDSGPETGDSGLQPHAELETRRGVT